MLNLLNKTFSKAKSQLDLSGVYGPITYKVVISDPLFDVLFGQLFVDARDVKGFQGVLGPQKLARQFFWKNKSNYYFLFLNLFNIPSSDNSVQSLKNSA